MPRDKFDRYYTPDDLAGELLGLLPAVTGSVLEPHVGGGAFARAIASTKNCRKIELTTGDLDPECTGLQIGDTHYTGDFLEHRRCYDWVIGNPPYKGAVAHVEHALAIAPRCAFLLRAGFLASRGRASFFAKHPPYRVWILPGRPTFQQPGQEPTKGTDKYDYAWIYWWRNWPGPTDLRWAPV